MRKRRAIAILVLALGLAYLAVGLFSLYHYREVSRVFAYYSVPTEIWMSNPEIAQTRSKLWSAFLEFSIISVIVLTVGVCLYLAKEWARKVWLALALLLLVMHVARLVADNQPSKLLLVERIAEVVLAGALALLSWLIETHEPVV